MRRLIFPLITAFAMLMGTTGVSAQEISAPRVLELLVEQGTTVDKADGPIVLGGYTTDNAFGLLVAIKDNATGMWWHRATCPGGVDLGCSAGSFQSNWSRFDAVLTPTGDRIFASFPAELPVGSYQVGLRPVAANGDVAAGPWYQFTVTDSSPVGPASATPVRNANVNEGLVTITSSHPFGSPAGGDSAGSALIGIKRLSDNKWMQADGSFGSAYVLQNMGIEAFGPWSFVGQTKVDLTPGRYGYWIEHYSPEDVKDSQVWTAFNVKACSQNCGNVAASGGASGSYSLANDGGVCYSVTSTTYLDGGTVRLTIRNDDTGKWVQPNPGTDYVDPNNIIFGGWKWFNNLGQIIQSDPNVGISCLFEDPLQLPVGNYHMGIKPVDSAGTIGSGSWVAFTVTP